MFNDEGFITLTLLKSLHIIITTTIAQECENMEFTARKLLVEYKKWSLKINLEITFLQK